MAEAIRELIQEKGISEDSVKKTIESAIKTAYKHVFGKEADNCIVKFKDDLSDVLVYARKEIVDGVYDPVTQIEIEEALKISEECEIGDEIDIRIDPKDFNRKAISDGKQTAHQGINESIKDNLYNEFKDKIGTFVIGCYQRERNGTIYVDLGKVEGVLPVKFQNPRERYEKNDRIKALVVDVKPGKFGLQLILSRSSPEYVRSIVELEIPEIADKTVEIYKIVRVAGYRTKIAVYSTKEDVDPVGACLGVKGVRIQNIIRELEGEKIDILKYDNDPIIFIRNALSPAEVLRVIILDEDKKQALAIVSDSQFSFAIGKQGLNVKLANKLCDWSIDVKTEEQAAELDLNELTSRKAAQNLFNNASEEEKKSYEQISLISDIPEIDSEVASRLKEAGCNSIENFLESYENNSLQQIEGITAEQIEEINKIIRDNVEFVDENHNDNSENITSDKNANNNASEQEEIEDEEEYFCPECGAKITIDMTHCPNCGVEFEFEIEE